MPNRYIRIRCEFRPNFSRRICRYGTRSRQDLDRYQVAEGRCVEERSLQPGALRLDLQVKSGGIVQI